MSGWQGPLAYFTDRASNYSDDLDTDDLASFLNNWEDTSDDAGRRSPSRLYSHEKLNPILDIPEAMSSEHYPEPPPPAQPAMDIEADFTVGEQMGCTKLWSALKLNTYLRSAVIWVLS